MPVTAKQHQVECPDCCAPMKLRESKHGLFYGCSRFPDCRGSHGSHPDGRPLGIPATSETKGARVDAHAAFDRLWKGNDARMTRSEAYLWMQSKLGISSDQAHVGMFDIARCQQLIAAVAKHFVENS